MYDFEKRTIEYLLQTTTAEAIEEMKVKVRSESQEDISRVYPTISGHLMALVEGLHKATKDLYERVLKAEDKCRAFSWAAECTLTDQSEDGNEAWEDFYRAVDIVELAIKNGSTDDQLRKMFGNGIDITQHQC